MVTFLQVLPFLFLFVNAKRGKKIDIYHQKHGDILQLRPQASVWGRMRNALRNNAINRWTEYRDSAKNFVLPYVVSGDFDPEERAIIFGAMGSIERNTCLRFKKRSGERDYVDIRNEADEGCYTSVGRNRGKNIVMLEANNFATCVEHDIVVHELFHTIGLWHEQMRHDRDEYINVRYDKIDPAFFPQFEKISKLESTTYNVEYDYTSVMHYSKDAFSSSPGEVTMETKNPEYQDIIGKVLDASPSDYIKICSIYKCGICMGKPFGKKAGTVPFQLSSPPPSFAERFTTPAKRPRSTHLPQGPSKDCADSFFCSSFMYNNRQAVCATRARRWCCASCSQ